MTTSSLLSYGEGPAIVLTMGPKEHPSMWEQQIETLAKTYRVLIASAVHDASQLKSQLMSCEPGPFALVGFADSAAACAEFAGAYPEQLSALVLVAPGAINVDALDTAKVPTAFIAGQEDDICPLAQVQATQEKVAGSFLVEVYQAGHKPFEECPVEFNDSLLSILQMAGHTGTKRPAHSNSAGYTSPA